MELLVLAKHIQATFVEPCILKGRVVSCRKIPAASKNILRMGQVFDLTKLKDMIYPALIVSQETYNDYASSEQQLSNTNTEQQRFCMHSGNPSPLVLCRSHGKLLENYYDATTNPMLERAVETHRQQQQQQQQQLVVEGDGRQSITSTTTTIHIHVYRKFGFLKTRIQDQLVVNQTLVQDILEHHLDFHPTHYKTVDGFLESMGIQENRYNAIHWRAELPTMNFMACAATLGQAKRVMNKNMNNDTSGSMPTVLISSLNKNPWLQWGVESSRGSKPLQSLMENDGFLKLDTVPDKPMTDMLHLAIWDQILAQKAYNFATCTKACRKKHPCSLCNYRGHFGEIVMGLRKKNHKESLACWPTK